jgi:CelD/BcsL family acetyltransferase involved in cellulose biosynthesis
MATRSDVAPDALSGGLLDPHDPRWQRFVDCCPDALPFHQPAWMTTLAECYGFRPFVVAVGAANGEIRGGIPLMEFRDPVRGRRWAALPFTDRCPPLLAGAEAIEPLAAAIRLAAADARIGRVEVRSPLPGFALGAVATVQELDLSPGADAVERGFSSAARRNTRKARREGVVVRASDAETDLIDAYYALHLLSRRRLGVPVQPRRFFRRLWTHMLQPGRGHLLLASVNGDPIAGVVLLYAGQTVVYKYGASDARAWGLRPNNVLFTEAIRWSAEAGYASFDFGRSDFADQGLRSFKLGWGAEERPLVYGELGSGHGHGDGRGGRGGRFLGDVIRRSPTWVCRSAGELLYRFAA